MKEKLEQISQQAKQTIAQAQEEKALEDVRISCLGRKGSLTEILRSLSTLPIEQRKEVGRSANKLRGELESLINTKSKELQNTLVSSKLQKEKLDIHLPPYPMEKGHLHPIRQTLKEMCDIFESIGFTQAQGPEIETEWYNFEALNIPKDHPARDIQDTFYLKDGQRLLRTHTSPVQIHVMEKQQPPVRVIVPGRVYRNEATDATHSAVFHQIEGLSIDEHITFADLKGTLTLFIHRYFGKNTKIRFRPSHFQFTEPSAEVDVLCTICGGKGCRVCKYEGWLEMLGCGMVHPNVLRAVKYDTEKYMGFAFGLGVERFAMFKYGIDDMRLFFENNLDFLRQF